MTTTALLAIVFRIVLPRILEVLGSTSTAIDGLDGYEFVVLAGHIVAVFHQMNATSARRWATCGSRATASRRCARRRSSTRGHARVGTRAPR